MKVILTKKGEEIFVDDSDYELLNKYTWFTHKYKHTSYAKTGKKGIPMHRMILELNDSIVLVDHIDKNGLNNQRDNLRLATKSTNAMNKNAYGEIPYKGVHIRRQKQKYFHKGSGEYRYSNSADSIVARIKVDGKSIYIGSGYKTIEDAALAYNEAAIKYHGEFAVLNKVA